MKAGFLLLLAILLRALPAATQDTLAPGGPPPALPDSAASIPVDTMTARDSFVLPSLTVTPQRFDTIVWKHHGFFTFDHPVALREPLHLVAGREEIFYCVIGLLLLFAIARSGFPRYLVELFILFFRSGARQRAGKDGLPHSPIPSVYLNLLAFLSGALFLNLVFRHYRLGAGISFWPLLGYTVAALAAIYTVKYAVLLVIGWIFRIPGPAGAYVFIVFTANKILGMVLLPVIILLAFSGPAVGSAALSFGFLLAGAVFAYRYFLLYSSVQRQVQLPVFHFLIYLLAVEIAPLLLINKVLFGALG